MAELTAPQQNRLLGQLANMLRTTEGDIAAPEFLPRGLDVMGLVRQLMLPSAETVEKLSYGDPLFRMPMQSYIPITADREYLADVVGMAPMVPAASSGATRLTNEAADALVRAITRNPEATAPQVLEETAMPLMSAIVPRQVATEFKMPTTLPQSDEFVSAVQNTPGAEITPDGLVMRLQRMQKPEQAGEESVRTGVFYLPEGSANIKYYKKGGDNTYGGSQPISGETLYKNPLFVKGATGGKAPEAAYDQLRGKGAYEDMRREVLQAANVMQPGLRIDRQDRIERIQRTLEEYGSDPSIAEYLIDNSTKGNQLAYAMQENIVANAVRNAGYDAVLGYSKKKTGDPFLSEVFDVRESAYPTPEGDFALRPEFESLLD